MKDEKDYLETFIESLRRALRQHEQKAAEPGPVNSESSPTTLDFDRLVDSIRGQFTLFDGMQHLQKSSNNEVVSQTINKVLAVGYQYYEAITRSLETAEKGDAFAKDAIARLTRANDSIDNLSQCLFQLANQAHADAKATHSKFRDICGALSTISRELASTIANIENEHEKDDLFSKHSLPLPDAVLSELFDVDAEFTPGLDEKTESSMAMSKNGHVDILAQLTQAKSDLEELNKYFSCIVEWWRCMNVGLQREMTRENWEDAGNQYAMYQTKIAEAQDCYYHLEFVQECMVRSRGNGHVEKSYRPPVVMAQRRVRVHEEVGCFQGWVIV
jgi:hypothetical protein